MPAKPTNQDDPGGESAFQRGRRKHRVRVPKLVLNAAVKDYHDGHSIASAASRAGIGVATLHRELVRRGVRRRSPNKRAKYGTRKEE